MPVSDKDKIDTDLKKELKETKSDSAEKQMLLDEQIEDITEEITPEPDLRENVNPPNLHASQGTSKCVSCAFFIAHNQWCQLHNVGVTAIQLCDNYQTNTSFYNSKSVLLESTLEETEEVKAGAKLNRGNRGFVQDIHDKALKLGAKCPEKSDYKELPATLVKSIDALTKLLLDSKVADTSAIDAISNTSKLANKESTEKSCVPNCVDTYNNTLRIVDENKEGLILENYMVLYGNQENKDLEGIATKNKNEDGSIGEYFNNTTNFESQYTKTSNIILDWEHGKAKPPEPGKDDPLGQVLWGTAKSTDTGLLVQMILNRHSEYYDLIKTLAKMGVLASSSEAISGGKEKTAEGLIKMWPVKKNTLTVAPMEYRMYLTNEQIEELKALTVRYPMLKNITENNLTQVQINELKQKQLLEKFKQNKVLV